MHPFYFVGSMRVSASFLFFLVISFFFPFFWSFFAWFHVFDCSLWSFVHDGIIIISVSQISSCSEDHVRTGLATDRGYSRTGILNVVWLRPDRLHFVKNKRLLL